MTNAGNVAGQIEGIRQQTVAILDELIARADQFDLADPPPALNHYRDKLRENSYKVLVVGEAKRGKSTFVNALIGRDILPTDVDVLSRAISEQGVDGAITDALEPSTMEPSGVSHQDFTDPSLTDPSLMGPDVPEPGAPDQDTDDAVTP